MRRPILGATPSTWTMTSIRPICTKSCGPCARAVIRPSISISCAAAGADRSIQLFPESRKASTRERSSTQLARTNGKMLFPKYRARARSCVKEFWVNGQTSYREKSFTTEGHEQHGGSEIEIGAQHAAPDRERFLSSCFTKIWSNHGASPDDSLDRKS